MGTFTGQVAVITGRSCGSAKRLPGEMGKRITKPNMWWVLNCSDWKAYLTQG